MPDTRHIILIHGVADISKQWRRAKPFLESHGFSAHFFDYQTLRNEPDIPSIVEGLAHFILENIGSGKYQIFAHSQGGLIAEWFDLFRGDENLIRIVTVGTPFQGNTLPLLAHRSIVTRLPIGRKQIQGLACMSPVLCALIRRRLIIRQARTSYISLISHSVGIFNMQSDGVVSVCAGNRNADYFLIDRREIIPLTPPAPTPSGYVKTNHLPLSMIRLLQRNRLPNPFSQLLLSALQGQCTSTSDAFTPSQCAVGFPAQFKGDCEFSEGIEKIFPHFTPDKKYIIVYCTIRNIGSYVTLAGQRIPLRAGRFTYLLEPAFLNIGT